MGTDLQEECRRLTRLGADRATAENRAALIAGLSSKWDGVQVAAAKALSVWGDHASVVALQVALKESASMPNRDGSTGALADCLSPHIREEHIAFVIDLYFFVAKKGKRYLLDQLFRALPTRQTIAALAALESKGGIDPQALRQARANAMLPLRPNSPN